MIATNFFLVDELLRSLYVVTPCISTCTISHGKLLLKAEPLKFFTLKIIIRKYINTFNIMEFCIK